jgi:hypothetical protein
MCDNLFELPEGMENEMMVCHSNVRFEKDELAVPMPLVFTKKGFDKVRDCVKAGTSDIFSVYHRIEGKSAGAMVIDESEFDGPRFVDSMDRGTIHPRQQIFPERSRIPSRSNLYILLFSQKFGFSLVFWWMKREVPCVQIYFLLSMGPWPEPFTKSNTNRMHERMIGMR